MVNGNYCRTFQLPRLGHENRFVGDKHSMRLFSFSLFVVQESNWLTKFWVSKICYTEMMHSDWLKTVIWLGTANKSALFECSIAIGSKTWTVNVKALSHLGNFSIINYFTQHHFQRQYVPKCCRLFSQDFSEANLAHFIESTRQKCYPNGLAYWYKSCSVLSYRYNV